ncbi:MAG: hypothetical protein N2316_06865 [Spirochaetes bacterium]|nr:hypothetical protein [Spirochaetota bacterium]
MKLHRFIGFSILWSICIFSLFCAKSGKDAEGKEVPAEFFTTWSLYKDCPTNIVTFNRNGTFEFIDCYHDDEGKEKRDVFTGNFYYLGDKKIKIDKPGEILTIYEIATENGKSVLKSSGFTFYSSFK